MQLFYCPDIMPPLYTMPADESRHALKVLRKKEGDLISIIDGKGKLYTAVITKALPEGCTVKVETTLEKGTGRDYKIYAAAALTKNMDRYEWFLEKATEVGCDVFIPLVSEKSERRKFNPVRAEKIIVSAMKQSVKFVKPELAPLSNFQDVVSIPFSGKKLIAHCNDGYERIKITETIGKGEDILILTGPEGDFSGEEVKFAAGNGFIPVTLGETRLRTETAALASVMAAWYKNL